MADPNKRLPNNVPGDFFVDTTCINCDTCRQLAPTSFGEAHDLSFVKAQPVDTDEKRLATRALLACPTGSIGTAGKNTAKEVMLDFPLAIDEGIYLNGFNSPKSFGGNSYFIVHEDGNWMVDSPKFLPHLVEQFRKLGGIKYIFLTHRDDVADSEQYAREFGAQRLIHAEDNVHKDGEILIEGHEARAFGADILVIPTPGHTRGHCVLLYRNKYLFSGDHIAWDRDIGALRARPSVCWYNWDEQKRSIVKLNDYSFQWILPGHGQKVHLDAATMKKELGKLIERLDDL
jgi:glyoxylase-like metal-dependent hydrolase (beta-lactamase superfamily II)/ferredoxin